MDIPQDSLPLPHTPQSPEDWTPYQNCLEFETARLFFSDVQMSAGNINHLLHLWGVSLAVYEDTPPFAGHKDLYQTIDATPIGDALWRSFGLEYSSEKPSVDVPLWMDKMHNVWYWDPQAVIKNIFSNADFDREIDYVPYHEFSEDSS